MMALTEMNMAANIRYLGAKQRQLVTSLSRGDVPLLLSGKTIGRGKGGGLDVYTHTMMIAQK
jgi:hypothetical protein